MILSEFFVYSKLILPALTATAEQRMLRAMMTTPLRIGSALLLCLIGWQLVATAQKVPITANNGVSQLSSARDKAREGQVAKLFEGIRRDKKLQRLKRIKHRTSLEQTVCTIALAENPPMSTVTNVSALYKTANPDSVTPELLKVATFNNLHPKYNPSYARYSIAVWPAKESQTAAPMYWVGVQLFWSSGMEFFDYHFTDDIYYRNEWKKSIAPACRNK